MSRRLVFASGALGVLAVCAACSLVTTIPDLTSGAGDASTSVDAGTGDGSAGDAAPTGFCRSRSPAPMFCDDFDDETSPFPRWGEGPDGQKTIDSRAARSLPNSLLASLPAGSPSCGRATVTKKLDGAFRAARVSLAVRFDDPADVGGYTAVMQQELLVKSGADSVSCQAILYVHPTLPPRIYEQAITSFADGGSATSDGTNHDMTTATRAGEWHVIDVDHDRRTGRLRALVDGNLEIDEPLLSTCAEGIAAADLQVGLFCVAPRGQATSVRVDDVTFDAR